MPFPMLTADTSSLPNSVDTATMTVGSEDDGPQLPPQLPPQLQQLQQLQQQKINNKQQLQQLQQQRKSSLTLTSTSEVSSTSLDYNDAKYMNRLENLPFSMSFEELHTSVHQQQQHMQQLQLDADRKQSELQQMDSPPCGRVLELELELELELGLGQTQQDIVAVQDTLNQSTEHTMDVNEIMPLPQPQHKLQSHLHLSFKNEPLVITTTSMFKPRSNTIAESTPHLHPHHHYHGNGEREVEIGFAVRTAIQLRQSIDQFTPPPSSTSSSTQHSGYSSNHGGANTNGATAPPHLDGLEVVTQPDAEAATGNPPTTPKSGPSSPSLNGGTAQDSSPLLLDQLINDNNNNNDTNNDNGKAVTERNISDRSKIPKSSLINRAWTMGSIEAAKLMSEKDAPLQQKPQGVFTGTLTCGGLASSKRFVSPSHYSNSLLVPIDKKSDFSLTIESSETVQTAKKSYTVYVINVRSDDLVWSIVRRYKHFRAFALKIQTEVPSLSAVDFPSKKYIGNMDEAFIKHRMECLQAFLTEICQSVQAKQSRNLKVFLDPNFSPSLKTLANPSREGYLYLLIQRAKPISNRKVRQWTKMYFAAMNSNLFYWRTRDQYAEAKGVIPLRDCRAKIVHTLDKLCIEVQIDGPDVMSRKTSAGAHHPMAVPSASPFSCASARPDDDEMINNNVERYYLCSESEFKLNQWLETINKESIIPLPGSITANNSTTDNNNNTSMSSIVNIPNPPPAPTMSLGRSFAPKLNASGTSTLSVKKSLAANMVLQKELANSFRVCINDQEWQVDHSSTNKGTEKNKLNKETINLLEATLSYKTVLSPEHIKLQIKEQQQQKQQHQVDLDEPAPTQTPTSTTSTTTPTSTAPTPITPTTMSKRRFLSLSRINPKSSNVAASSSASLSSSLSSSQQAKVLADRNKQKLGDFALMGSEEIVYISESIIHMHENSGTIGRITLTNYRLHFTPYYTGNKQSKKCELDGVSVVLGSIKGIVKCTGFTPDNLKYYAFEIRCKDFHRVRFMHLPGSTQQKANARLYEIFENLIFLEYPKLYCFGNTEPLIGMGWDVYNPIEEYKRMGIPNESWRISDFNNDYYYSPTYPASLVVPKKITDLELINIASFRSKGRIPAVVWKSAKDHPVIIRCSQPVIGVTGKRCFEDEKLVECVRLANLLSEKVYILDARPQINAVANQVMGMGYEGSTKGTYNNVILKFLGIENIHKMRDAQTKLSKAVMFEREPERQQAKMAKATELWLGHIRAILSGVVEIVDTIRFYKSSVIVHCSDGWDRTSQLCALAELILDAKYRTILGFQRLIEKEWLSFGHKFESRIGHGSRDEHTIEHAPVFVQFIDCVYQVMRQHASKFEFNTQYLQDIVHHLYSCRFGTFLFDSEAERVNNDLRSRTPSLWSYLNQHTTHYRNAQYQVNNQEDILSIDTMSLGLWKEYYGHWRNVHGH
ncbi:hypothetical protein SAMD00019534_037610 [Acytostelium subglobosum LB1]|uniref:hypothetical protein n=1 Tax=Acytostelium subglobosum LB1 TaxID=1410327 RepID=UPI000645148B|nr:hypothetical protein SAMD00019534_037610 [Acytostelium subglobosum LB1]GAM20586.1 hypothetical protein SAMD00019534_037610 [Acytostelium subglobosum LB1]|eukprot:XP_012760107.1 hypothetical protein SAMD00019534_037610 [Acytostelium subglobosum LB1]